MPTLRQLLNWGQQQLHLAKIKSASLDSEILLAHIIQRPKTFLYSQPDFQLLPRQVSTFKRLISQRCHGLPVAYLIGYKEFYNLKFKGNRHTLIPRPETELIVETLLDSLKKTSGRKILLDIGTGSGNIIISVLKNLPPTKKHSLIAMATDNSTQALKTARLNAKTYRLNHKITFICGNLLKPVLKAVKKLTLAKPVNNLFIAANLPYLPIKIYRQNFDQLKYEPQSSLIAKQNGLNLYQQLLTQIKTFLPHLPSHTTTLYFEILPFQRQKLKKIILSIFPQADIKIKKDLNSQPRLFIIQIKSK